MTAQHCQVIGADGISGMMQPEVEVDYSGLSMELELVVQRMQLLGFNAVRLPMTFSQLYTAQPRNYTLPCEHPSNIEVGRPSLAPVLQPIQVHAAVGNFSNCPSCMQARVRCDSASLPPVKVRTCKAAMCSMRCIAN